MRRGPWPGAAQQLRSWQGRGPPKRLSWRWHLRHQHERRCQRHWAASQQDQRQQEQQQEQQRFGPRSWGVMRRGC